MTKDHPSSASWIKLFEKKFGNGKIPPLVGVCLMGTPIVIITTVGHL
jgi:hypothetical protein